MEKSISLQAGIAVLGSALGKIDDNFDESSYEETSHVDVQTLPDASATENAPIARCKSITHPAPSSPIATVEV